MPEKDFGRKGAIPVLFFQAGNARHLPYTFWQARKWAGDSPLILLGDQSNRYYRGLEHVPIRDFASTVPRLRNCYVHISSNSAEFEFYCLARWLVMAEFARRQGLQEFLYLDSDVLIYDAPTEIVDRFAPCRIGAGWVGSVEAETAVVSPAVTWIGDVLVLQELEAMIFDFFGDHSAVLRLQGVFVDRIEKGLGGLSDMCFLARLARQLGGAFLNVWDPKVDGVVDINMFQDHGFHCPSGIKEMEFRGGQPHGFYQPQGQWRRFSTLHFGGHSKKHIPRYLGRPWDRALVGSVLWERVRKGLGWHKPST